MDVLKIGTTFSGIGAPEQAIKQLNIPHIIKWGCDIDKYAKETYFANHSAEKWYDDITKINTDELEEVDLFCFGSPCVDVSTIGHQDLSRGRSMLVNHSLDIMDKIRPKFILFENVIGLLNQKFEGFFNYIKERIKKEYNFHLLVLNSKDFGIPQNRKRTFCIGIRKDLNDIDLKVTKHSIVPHFKYFLEKNVDEKYYIGLERTNKIIEITQARQKNFILRNELGEVNQASKTSFFGDKKIRYTGISYCQNTIDIHGLITADNIIRKFTPRECARMQGFPNSFIIHPKDRHAYKQAGNTITVNVLEAIFKELLVEYLG